MTPKAQASLMHKVIDSVGQLKDSNCPGRACYSEVCRKEEQNRMCFSAETGPKEKEEEEGGYVTYAELLFSNFPLENSFLPCRNEWGQKRNQNVIVMDSFPLRNKMLEEGVPSPTFPRFLFS